MSSSILLCPHCHAPVDAATLDTACSSLGEWRICPACDEPLLFQARKPEARPASDRAGPAPEAKLSWGAH